MPASLGIGWGFQSALNAVTQDVAAVRSVLRNVGVARQIIAAPRSAIRVSKITWRVDLAPDLPAGSVNSPTRWRLVVVVGELPADVSLFQEQAWPAGSHPEIPKAIGTGAPKAVLWDAWLDFAAGDPGLNQLAREDFADAGPSVGPGEIMSVLLCPILDTNLNQALPGAANALMTIGVFGTGANTLAELAGGSGGNATRSLPRFDVARNAD